MVILAVLLPVKIGVEYLCSRVFFIPKEMGNNSSPMLVLEDSTIWSCPDFVIFIYFV